MPQQRESNMRNTRPWGMKWMPSGKQAATCLLGCLWASQLCGQGFLQVQVVDQTTRRPAQFVNVYLAHTMMGGSSDAQGKVTLTKVPPGLYQLVCSLVGYNSVTRTVSINAADSIRLSITMTPAVT